MSISEHRKWVEHASGPYGLLKLRLLEAAAAVMAVLTVAPRFKLIDRESDE